MFENGVVQSFSACPSVSVGFAGCCCCPQLQREAVESLNDQSPGTNPSTPFCLGECVGGCCQLLEGRELIPRVGGSATSAKQALFTPFIHGWLLDCFFSTWVGDDSKCPDLTVAVVSVALEVADRLHQCAVYHRYKHIIQPSVRTWFVTNS